VNSVRKNKIVVAGCSLSDYTGVGVSRVYGEILAKSLKSEYIHNGAGAGSNYRMWRTVTNLVMDGKITCDDLVIMQYTEVTRDEFWHAKHETRDSHIYVGINKQKVREPKYGGDIVRWKTDIHSLSGSWSNGVDVTLRKFFKLKDEYFTSVEFEEERFKYNHYLFHNAMMSKGIKVVYVVGAGDLKGYGAIFKHLFNENGEIHITGDFDKHVFDDDAAHMNQKGHERLAEILEEQLKEKKLI
jgi:hypothetical protein